MKANEGKHLEPPILSQKGKAAVGPTSKNEVGAHKRHAKGMKAMKGGKKDCY